MTDLASFDPVGPAEIALPCADLAPTLAFFVGELGFRVETIFPADAPQVASLSGYGLRLRLAPGDGDPGRIRLPCRRPGRDRVLTAPNGTRIELVADDPPVDLPPLRPAFLVTRTGEGPAAQTGRAGMHYRDLIPGRLGGRYIASHISIDTGGPVADWVHFHKIAFQMILCRRGWARLVYEDQGPPFLMQAGDCVLQPPRIRHRVLESSSAFEVVEISCPAAHETLADHGLDLPTPGPAQDRDFGGQRFHHHIASQVPWTARDAQGFERRDTGVGRATGGVAEAQVIRAAGGRELQVPAHDGELLFGFLLEGSAVLDHAGSHPLGPTDAFVIPAGRPWSLRACSDDLALLQVTASAKAG